MVTLRGLLRTIQATSNFWDAFLLRNSLEKKMIKFRNGVEVETTYSQYTVLRDWFVKIKNEGFSVEKKSGGYLIQKGDFSFQTQSILTAKPFFDFLLSLLVQGWIICRTENQYNLHRNKSTYLLEQVGDDLFYLDSDKAKVMGSMETMHVYFYECEGGLYNNDYDDKIVLDVGGFTGETAVFFSSKGAKKIIIYEPFYGHQALIQKNIAINHINADLHFEGIGEKNEEKIVFYDNADIAFGLSNAGKNQTTIKIKDVIDVISESKADIAKIDCEGAETVLLNIPSEVLRLIDFYFLETHSPEIEKAIVSKFYDSGFKMTREPVRLAESITMLYFKKSEVNGSLS